MRRVLPNHNWGMCLPSCCHRALSSTAHQRHCVLSPVRSTRQVSRHTLARPEESRPQETVRPLTSGNGMDSGAHTSVCWSHGVACLVPLTARRRRGLDASGNPSCTAVLRSLLWTLENTTTTKDVASENGEHKQAAPPRQRCGHLTVGQRSSTRCDLEKPAGAPDEPRGSFLPPRAPRVPREAQVCRSSSSCWPVKTV